LHMNLPRPSPKSLQPLSGEKIVERWMDYEFLKAGIIQVLGMSRIVPHSISGVIDHHVCQDRGLSAHHRIAEHRRDLRVGEDIEDDDGGGDWPSLPQRGAERSRLCLRRAASDGFC